MGTAAIVILNLGHVQFLGLCCNFEYLLSVLLYLEDYLYIKAMYLAASP